MLTRRAALQVAALALAGSSAGAATATFEDLSGAK